MRKRHVSLGRPRSDPRRYRFAVPNEMWEYKLQPAEFVILSYLCYRQTHDRERKVVSAKAVAGSLHLTTATVEKHLTVLVSKGLVTEGGAPALKGSGYIPGAVLLPVGTIDEDTASAVIPEKDPVVLVYFRSGNRSACAPVRFIVSLA